MTAAGISLCRNKNILKNTKLTLSFSKCFDGVKRLGLIRGKLRKKIWINNGDIILVSLREYQDEKGDVILKYSADEARSLYVFFFPPSSTAPPLSRSLLT